ncbi:MAG: fibronectin type III domain-containing protein, partial [Nitrospira sp.]|nr:fibronectin type III domain-containing protein [Nitrospira sp.]
MLARNYIFMFLNIVALSFLITGCGGNSGNTGNNVATSFEPPVAPGNCFSSPLSNKKIEIIWEDNSVNEKYFKIYRCKGSECTPKEYLSKTNTNTTHYVDTSVSEGTTYCYTICAYNSKGQTCSNISCAKTATIIDNGSGDAYNPQIAISSNGNAMVVWQQDHFKATFNDFYIQFTLYARMYNAITGTWSNITMLMYTNDIDNIYNPQVAMDSQGNAIVVWQQYNENFVLNIYARRYIADSDVWGPVETIDTG